MIMVWDTIPSQLARRTVHQPLAGEGWAAGGSLRVLGPGKVSPGRVRSVAVQAPVEVM